MKAYETMAKEKQKVSMKKDMKISVSKL